MKMTIKLNEDELKGIVAGLFEEAEPKDVRFIIEMGKIVSIITIPERNFYKEDGKKL